MTCSRIGVGRTAVHRAAGRLPLPVGLVMVSTVMLLEGCAVASLLAVPVVVGGVAIMADPELEGIPKAETNRKAFSYSIQNVWLALNRVVERNDRKVVESDADSHSMRVSYPFSLLANNWGGVITLKCVADGQVTVVIIMGSGRDANWRIRRIGDEILHDVGRALEQ